MSKLLFMLFFCLVPDILPKALQYTRSSCLYREIKHGRMRGRPGARLARFSCNMNYELVGNKYATCRLGEWDVPMPVCVRAGCDDVELENGIAIPTHRGAWVVFYCFPGFKLAGSPAVYCDGYRWNATTPKCVPDKGTEPQLICDFESESLCGWRQDDLHDFDWTRLNTKTPSAFLLTGPSYDHTLGKGQSGYYMFIESTSKHTNQSARLISPIYDGSFAKNGCFSFFYHMYGKSIGGLRVYQIPEGFHQHHANLSWSDKQDYLLFEKWGDHGDFWFRNVSKLNDTASNFQIVIEGIRGSSFTSDIAIDDVAILQGAQCEEASNTAVTPSEISEYCAGSCDILGKRPNPAGRRCACSAACIADDNCCPDFFELCVYNSGMGSADDDDTTDNRTSDQPLTEKLIRTPSTSPSTTTTISSTSPPKTSTTTTTTPRPSTTTRPTTVTTTPKTIPTTTTSTTTRKPVRSTSTAKTTPTTRRSISSTTRLTIRPVTVRPTYTSTTSTTRTTTIQSTSTTRVLRNTTSVKSEASKSKMEQAIQERTVSLKKSSSSSGATAAILSTLALAACCVGAALSLRSARGRAALARLRGRATADPEVRYLTRDDD